MGQEFPQSAPSAPDEELPQHEAAPASTKVFEEIVKDLADESKSFNERLKLRQ